MPSGYFLSSFAQAILQSISVCQAAEQWPLWSDIGDAFLQLRNAQGLAASDSHWIVSVRRRWSWLFERIGMFSVVMGYDCSWGCCRLNRMISVFHRSLNKKSELMLMRCARAHGGSCLQVILVCLYPFHYNSLFCSHKLPNNHLKLMVQGHQCWHF